MSFLNFNNQFIHLHFQFSNHVIYDTVMCSSINDTLVSSANSIKNSMSDALEKSLLYNIKRRGSDALLVYFFIRMTIIVFNNCSLDDK